MIYEDSRHLQLSCRGDSAILTVSCRIEPRDMIYRYTFASGRVRRQGNAYTLKRIRAVGSRPRRVIAIRLRNANDVRAMPELLVLLTFLGFIAYRVAAAAEKRRVKPPAELALEARRLDLRCAWLRERIERATLEHWGEPAVQRLCEQLREATRDRASLPAVTSAESVRG